MRRLQYDAPSQAVRNLITNPELVADVSDKLLYKNSVTNPSFETAGSTFDLWVNNIMNPSFKTTSATPVEVRKNLATNPSFEATSGTPTVRTNLISYPNFEAAGTLQAIRTNLCTNPRGVNAFGSYGTQTITPNVAITGHPEGITTANRVTYGTNSNNPGVVLVNPVTSGTVYTISAWVFHETAPSSGTQGFAQAGVVSQNPPPAIVQGVWQRLSWIAYTTSGTSQLGFRVSSAIEAGSYLITGVLCEARPDLGKFFDGTTPAQQNLITNPSFATNTTGWSPISATLTRVTDQGGDGHSCEISQTTADGIRNTAIWLIGSDYNAGGYTVSFDMKGTDASFTNVRAFLYDTETALVRAQATTPLIKDGNFNRYTFNLTADGVFDKVYMEVQGVGIPIGTKAWLDRAQLERSNTASPFYYEGTGDFSYAWGGTANTSTSLQQATTFLGWGQLGASYRSIMDPKMGPYSGAILTRGINGDGLWPSTNLDVIAGRTYSYSLWVKATSAHSLTAGFRWYDASLVQVGTDTNVTVTSQLVVGSWALITATATAPTNAVKLQVMMRIYETHTPTTLYADGAICVESMTAVPYFDGATAASGDFTYAWTGAANTTTSIQKGIGVTETSVANSVPISSTEWKGLGSKSLRVVPQLTHITDSYAAVSGDFGGIRMGMVAGRTYTVSATIRLSAPLTGTLSTKARKIVFYHKSPADQNYIETSSAQAANVAGETRLSVTVTIPDTATEAFVRLYNGASSGNGDVWWDNLLVEESTSLKPYFDGTNPATQNLVKTTTNALTGMTITPGIAYSGYTWSRAAVAAGTGGWIARQYVALSELTQGETYTASVTVANDQAFSQSVSIDWCDTNNTSYTIAPGEVRRLVVTSTRNPYSDIYRFADLQVNQSATEGRSILFKDWLVELGTTSGAYYAGTGDSTYAWAGAANASTSTQRATAVIGNVASKSSGAGYIDSRFFTYQSTDETTGKKIGRWFSPSGTPSSAWRVLNINNQSINYASIIAGSTYTLIMRYRSSGWGSGQTFTVGLMDGTTANPVIGNSAAIPLNTGWTDYRRTFTALINGLSTTNLYITLPVTPQATTDGIFDISEWALVPGAYTGPFFDGSSATTSSDFTVAWGGTADASVSKIVATSVSGTPGNYSGRLTWQSNNGPVAGKKSIAVIAGTPNVDTFAQTPNPFTGETLGGRTFTVLATRKTTENYIATGADGRAWRPHWTVNKSGGGTQSYQPSTVESTVAGTYKFKWTFTFDADVTTSAFFRLYNGSPTVGNVVWWDDLAIMEGAYPGDYFDGDTTDTASNTYLWDGTAGASTSSMRGLNIKGVWSGHRANVYSSSDTPFSGSHKVKASVTQIGYFPRLISNSIAVVPGRRYTAFAKMKCATQPVQIAIAWVTGGTTSPIGQAASNGNWVRPYISDIAPENTAFAQLYIGVPNDSPLNTEFEVDSILFTDRSYDGPFGSGSSYGWEWEGAEHASASKGYPVGLIQLAGKPLFVGELPGQYVLTDIDPAKNPIIPADAPRTIYTIVDNLMDVADATVDVVWTYGVDDLSDGTHPNQTIMMREQSQVGTGFNTVIARRTGGAGPITTGVPSTGKQILINGMDERGYLFSGFNKTSLTFDSLQMSIPHERIAIATDTLYHRHVVTYIYRGVHSSALRAEMVRLLADHYNIPGLG